MKFTPAHISVYVSGIHGAVFGEDGVKKETDYQINKALSYLYEQGFRRMSTHRMPRTGDGERYKIVGLK